MYILIIIKKFSLKYKKKKICLVNIRMINLSFNKLKLIAQVRNISNYENKSKEDLIKALGEPKPEIPKLKTLKIKPKIISSKLKISKLKTPKPKPRPKIRVNEKKLEKLRQDFDELRHEFDKKELDRYRKAFYDVKNYENLSVSKIKKAKKSLTKLKVQDLKKFVLVLIVLIIKTLTIMIIIMILLMVIEKLEVLEHYLKN